MLGRYFSDEQGAAAEQAARKRREIKRIEQGVRKHGKVEGKIVLLAEAETESGPARAWLNGQYWLHARRYYVAVAVEAVTLVQVPQLLPDWAMTRREIIVIPRTGKLPVQANERLGWTSVNVRWPGGTILLNFDPAWRAEGQAFARILAETPENDRS
jgi:hypothetical protein